MTSDDSPNNDIEFEEDAARGDTAAERLLLNLDGYEGPIDLLLDLARDQKVDLTRISILQLADQYLTFITRARELRLELAADYLVMAAWLAFLKSRLLLPVTREDGDEMSAEEMAARLAFQLQHLEAMRKVGRSLLGRPQLNRDFFPRGAPEPVETSRTSVYEVSLYELLRAYASFKTRDHITALRIDPTSLYSTERALERLRALIGDVPNWTQLSAFLPEELGGPLVMRSALASTFSASLELVKEGRASLRQSGAFAPLYLRRRDGKKQETDTRP